MNLPSLKKTFLHPLVVGLLGVNLLLLFFLFVSTPFFKPTRAFSESVKDYPEIARVKGQAWDFQTTAQFFKDLAVKKGGAYGYHALAVALNNGYIEPNIDAHLLGHVVGDVLYKQKGIEGIKVCTDDIRNACSHSIVVGYLLDFGEKNLPIAVATCKEAPGGKGAYTMCIHGLGHGVLAYENYDMRKAVALCSQIGTEEYHSAEVGQCVGGVTMEMMTGVHNKELWSKQAPNYLKADNPLSPCNLGFFPKGSTNFCYAYLTPHLFKVAGASLAQPDPKFFGKAMSYCEGLAVNNPDRKVCFGSFGKEYVVLANARNVQSVTQMNDSQLKLIESWCAMGPAEALSPCLGSALESLYWGGENEPEVSIRFCKVLREAKGISECLQSLSMLVMKYKGDDENYKKAFCEKFPENERLQCRTKILTQS